MKLEAPPEFWELSKEEKSKVTNGCGPGGPINSLVPDHILGVRIKKACLIHDYMYHHAKSDHDFKKADKTFLRNLRKLISSSKLNAFQRALARDTSFIYYLAVRGYSAAKY